MLRILKAIGAAIMSMLRASAYTLTAPLRWLTGGGGGVEMVDVPDVAEEQDLAAAPSPTGPDMQKFWEDLARRIQDHCADCLLDDERKLPPVSFPRDVKDWLQGLDRGEVERVMNAEQTAVCAHIQELFKLPDVRKFGPLPVLAWQPDTPAPSPEQDDGPGYSVSEARGLRLGFR